MYFYDWINNDPRRQARADYYIFAGLAGGLTAGIVTSPFELVFARMQVDELYPMQARRNYKHIFDGLFRVAEEGALMRGSIANALKLAAITSSMTPMFDWCKENSYFFLGPSWLNRFWATAVAVTLGTIFSMPFDMIRVRL